MATLLHYVSLENPMDIGAWGREAIVHGVTKSGTRLKSLSMHTLLQNRKSYNSLYSSAGNCPRSFPSLFPHFINCVLSIYHMPELL